MRYMNADNIVFTNADGKSVTLKDFLPIPDHASESFKVPAGPEAALDEIASRTDAYGENGEGQAYRVFDENAAEIVDAGFDLGLLKTLRVPV